MKIEDFLTNSTCAEQTESITAEDILYKMQCAIDLICPILYYQISKLIDKGQLIYIKQSEYNPEYIVINKDDFEFIENNLKFRQLKNIIEAPLSSYTVNLFYSNNWFTDLNSTS
jgi:hypothetical protein